MKKNKMRKMGHLRDEEVVLIVEGSGKI